MSKRSSPTKLFMQSVGLGSDENDTAEELKIKVQDLCEFGLNAYKVPFKKSEERLSSGFAFYYSFKWQKKEFQVIASLQIPNRNVTISVWSGSQRTMHAMLCSGELKRFYPLRGQVVANLEKFLTEGFKQEDRNDPDAVEWDFDELKELRSAEEKGDFKTINRIRNKKRKLLGKPTLTLAQEAESTSSAVDEELLNNLKGNVDRIQNGRKKKKGRVFVLLVPLVALAWYALSKSSGEVANCLTTKSESQCLSECTSKHSHDYCTKAFARRNK